MRKECKWTQGVWSLQLPQVCRTQVLESCHARNREPGIYTPTSASHRMRASPGELVVPGPSSLLCLQAKWLSCGENAFRHRVQGLAVDSYSTLKDPEL